MKKRTFFTKGIALMLAAVMSVSILPVTSYAKKAEANGLTANATKLSETQSIVYNTATLYNYSDTFYQDDKKTINQIVGKGDYNEDTMKIAYDLDSNAEKWEGLYFNSGNIKTATPYTVTEQNVPVNIANKFSINESSSGKGQENHDGEDGLWNGDTETKAWTTWVRDGNSSGWITLAATETQKVKNVRFYLVKESNPQNASCVYPKKIEIYNGDKTDEGLLKTEALALDSTKNSAIVEIALDEEITTDTITFEFSYENSSYIILSELELYNETDLGERNVTISKNLADYNEWSGTHDDQIKRSYIYSGLVEPTLINGQIQFKVPQAGVFDATDTSNKEVYTNVGIPFIYDSSTGYYTFDEGASGYSAHFDDTNDNDTIDAAEKQSNVNLVLDKSFEGHDLITGATKKAGFFPFNCYGETDTNAVYHFGMNTVINFTMTKTGTVDGNENSDAITFEFAGDDDVWVFIDGQLVLDLGGIHDSVSAKIDFKANEITMWSTNTNYGSGDIRQENVGSTEPGYVTELGQILNSENQVGAIAKSYETFADEGEHQLAIYYLERGRGESNCKIQYNLPTQDALEVTKSIQLANGEEKEITSEEWSALNALTFKMRVLKENKVPVTGKYALYNSSEYVGTFSTDENGYFTLKNNQTARFVGTLEGEYTVEEIATEDVLPAAVWKTAKWSGTLTTSKVTNLTEETTENDATENTSTMSYTVSNLEVTDNFVDTLNIYCTNYISRPFVSVSGETIVIDYGLPVKIDIMANDVQSSGKGFIISNVSEPSYGTVKVLDEKGNVVDEDTYSQKEGYYYLEYTPNTYMSNAELITYTYKVLSSEISGEAGYSYPTGVATIIPATTMYYEENFLNSSGNNYIKFSTATGYTTFSAEGTGEKIYQEPGVVGTANDSVYGTDQVYLTGNSDSNGTSYKADTTEGPAAFRYEFTGTGTAFFARTSAKSGYLRVSVKDNNGNDVLYDAEGGSTPYWYIDTKYAQKSDTDEIELYNIPVFQLKDLDYGTYTVTVTVAKPSQWYTDQNEFYLDGVRVYDPIDMTDDTAANYQMVYEAYKKDLEADAQIKTLRDYMLDVEAEIDEETGEIVWKDKSQVMFTDTNDKITFASEYESNGPKQELYMTQGQSIRFVLNDWNTDKPTDARLYIGAKVPKGAESSFTVNGTKYTVKNTVDCYYDITSAIQNVADSHDGLCVIEITGEGLLSLTNLKCTGFPEFSLAGMDEDIDGSEGYTVYAMLKMTVEDPEYDPTEDTSEQPSEGEDSDNTDVPSEGENSGNTDQPSGDGENGSINDSSKDEVIETIQKVVETIKNVLKGLWNQWRP